MDRSEQLETKLREAKVLWQSENTNRICLSCCPFSFVSSYLLPPPLSSSSSCSVQDKLHDVERKYEETCRKVILIEQDLERAEDRADVAEDKCKNLQGKLTQLEAQMRSYSAAEEKAYEVYIYMYVCMYVCMYMYVCVFVLGKCVCALRRRGRRERNTYI